MKASRFNDGKIDLTLLPLIACEEEAKVWAFGAAKYGRDNWRMLWADETINVALASLMRHAFALSNGELNDPESGLPHAAHIRCNAAMLLEYQRLEEMSQVQTTEPDKYTEETINLIIGRSV